MKNLSNGQRFNFIANFLKYIVFLGLFIFLAETSQSQIAVNMDGTLPDASAMLDVQATGLGMLAPRMTEAERPASPALSLLIYQTDNDPGYYYYDGSAWNKIGTSHTDFWEQNGSNIFFNAGKVGMGTNNPLVQAHIKGGIELLRLESSSNPMLSFYEGNIYKAWFQAYDDDFYIVNRMPGRLRLRTNNVDRLVIESDGSVVIGGAAGADGYRLSVNGKMACEEILIDAMAFWPDYVFEQDYPLLSIDDFEKSITENKHLPGIPSAQEITENGGHQIGEMQRQLLEKVEELSLYVIELNKRMKKLETKNSVLKEKLSVK
ncbi:MAG: hypothetical protein GXO89_01885 [Chlorobi bacterium]|nr:hypothetical protein [Chlorobiota bacterium]